MDCGKCGYVGGLSAAVVCNDGEGSCHEAEADGCYVLKTHDAGAAVGCRTVGFGLWELFYGVDPLGVGPAALLVGWGEVVWRFLTYCYELP